MTVLAPLPFFANASFEVGTQSTLVIYCLAVFRDFNINHSLEQRGNKRFLCLSLFFILLLLILLFYLLLHALKRIKHNIFVA